MNQHLGANIDSFFSKYSESVILYAYTLREILKNELPDCIEQLDIKAGMLAFCYGQKYSELICVLIPSKKGLKLGFNRGTQLSDPENILEGSGKISRYVQIISEEQIHSSGLQALISDALRLYKAQL